MKHQKKPFYFITNLTLMSVRNLMFFASSLQLLDHMTEQISKQDSVDQRYKIWEI
jgi:hypothetical protein